MSRHLDLRLLESFLVVAEELSFTQAARRLHMSQPPLSLQIKQLEAKLDTLLFERNKRSVQLTAAGEVLREESERLFAIERRARQRVTKIGKGKMRGTSPSDSRLSQRLISFQLCCANSAHRCRTCCIPCGTRLRRRRSQPCCARNWTLPWCDLRWPTPDWMPAACLLNRTFWLPRRSIHWRPGDRSTCGISTVKCWPCSTAAPGAMPMT